MKRRNGFQVMVRLIGLVGPLVGFMALAVLMGLAGHLCAAFLTVFGGYAALSALGLDVPMGLAALFACMGAFALLRGVLRYGEQSCNHFIAFKLLALIRERVFQALRRLCPAKLEGRDRGDLIAVITSDIELLEVFYAHTISPVVIAALFTLILCGFIGSFHPALGLLALAAYLAVGGAIPLAVSKLSGDGGLRLRTQAGELSVFVLDSLRGLDEVIQYGQGAARLDEMNARTATLSVDEGRMKRTAGLGAAAANTVILAFDLAMLLTSASLYQRGSVDISGVVIPTIALMSSFGPCVALANLGSTLQNTFAAGNRVLDILDETPAVDEITGQGTAAFSGAQAEAVTFSYGGGAVLEDISVEVPEHAVVGIVGRSGSGKSTLLKLLMRFWAVERGAIKLSGREVGQIDTAALRDMESFVTQDTHLFHDSIKNNLRVANLNATDEEITAACKKAAVHDFIMALPRGYDTPVGELGDTLSGGERQRLGLARAFLHGGPLMLLDEPTSNLDSLNEAAVLRALAEEREGRTVVLVSHRKSTLRIADKIYSVEDGRVS